MSIVLSVGLSVFSVVAANTLDYESYLKSYGKDFSRLEDPTRLKIFDNVSKIIKTHNADSSQTYELSLNRFADWKKSELKAYLPQLQGHDNGKENLIFSSYYGNSYNADDRNYGGPYYGGVNDDYYVNNNNYNSYDDGNNYYQPNYNIDTYYGSYGGPIFSDEKAELNWATSNNPNGFPVVQAQGQVQGPSWAVMAAAAVTASVNINANKRTLVHLKPDLIMENAKTISEAGNLPSGAFAFTVKSGIATDKLVLGYFNSGTIATITDFGTVTANDEESMMIQLQVAPLTVNICAGTKKFLMYHSGILNDADACAAHGIDHTVLLVGYGTDDTTNQDYWIVQNSFGRGWGEDGFARIQRGSNFYSIASKPMYPVGAALTTSVSSFFYMNSTPLGVCLLAVGASLALVTAGWFFLGPKLSSASKKYLSYQSIELSPPELELGVCRVSPSFDKAVLTLPSYQSSHVV